MAYLRQQIKSSVWHSRLGHPTNDIVHTMLKSASLPILLDSPMHVCPHCLSGKMHQLPFSSTHVKASFPFQRVHSDVWGPFPCKSTNGYQYVVIFIDEYTGFTWLYPLFAKSEVFTKFTHLYAYVENQFSTSIKCLQSDGGGEYMSIQGFSPYSRSYSSSLVSLYSLAKWSS